MQLARLSVIDFRNLATAQVAPAPGLTVIVGANGEGKTNLLEAAAYLATLSSFRRAPRDALVGQGAERAVLRAEVDRGGRRTLLEAELPVEGRDRVLVNRQPLRRARDLLGRLRVTVFTPDDLSLVKGGPAERRQYLDDLLVGLQPRHDATRRDLERVVRQRTTLLRQLGGSRGRLAADEAATLDVWDAKLARLGETWAAARADLVTRLEPVVGKAYGALAGDVPAVELRYQRCWGEGSLAGAVAAARHDDLRRGVTTVGPHRDDLLLTLDGWPARTRASQGEQRSLALALRLAGHDVVAEGTGSPPVLLLDDVFSELDADRSAALLRSLPPAQALLTTAGPLPSGAHPERVLRLRGGRVEAA